MSSNKINPADRYAPADFFVKQTFQTQIIKIIIHHACLLVVESDNQGMTYFDYVCQCKYRSGQITANLQERPLMPALLFLCLLGYIFRVGVPLFSFCPALRFFI